LFIEILIMTKKYFGINPYNHDLGAVVLNENGELEFYAEVSRFSKQKYYNNINPILKFLPKPQKKDIICLPSFFNNPNPINYWINPIIATKWSDTSIGSHLPSDYFPNFCINHHLCHILSSWSFRENDDTRFCMAYDGSGSTANGETSSCLGGFIGEDGFSLKVLEPKIPTSGIVGNLLGGDTAGKTMGLVGFLNEDLGSFKNSEVSSLIYSIFEKVWPLDVPNFNKNKNISKNDMILSAKLYKLWMDFTWEKILINLQNFTPNKELGIVVGGGTCLALELNTNISNLTKDFVFGPPVNDSGLALGAACYGYFLDKGRWPPALNTPSIMYLQEPLPKTGVQEPKEIAKLIAQDKVVGLLRGKAECGPRALGFRSILANASKYQNLKRVSQDLKGREYYRPLAPMVTEESFDRYFIGPKGEYMQFKCECTLAAQTECPAIVHKDNSSRPQVVNKNKDPWLHELLVEYGKMTGSECLINTSLNGPGKPICNTYNDALSDFKDKEIELISIPLDD
jgi:carbamoyltransferase